MVNCLLQLIGTCSNCVRVAYNSQFAESKLDWVTGGFCGILLNHLITAGFGGTAPLKKTKTKTLHKGVAKARGHALYPYTITACLWDTMD